MRNGYHVDFMPRSKTVTITADGRLFEDYGTIMETETVAVKCGNDAPWIGYGELVFVPDEGELERCGIIPVEYLGEEYEAARRRNDENTDRIMADMGID